eukprot:jgi/Pico_ML_1/52010/g2790.t1
MPGDWGEKSEAALKVAEFLHIPVEDVITPWSLTQDRSVLKQLELGSRRKRSGTSFAPASASSPLLRRPAQF